MDDQADEDDAYLDDDLDALPINAFHQLQEDAFRSTQQQQQPPVISSRPEIPRPVATELVGGFGRHALIPENAALQPGPQHPSSDYGDLEDDMLDGEIFDGAAQAQIPVQYNRGIAAKEPGESTQREQWRVQRYGAPSPASASRALRPIGPEVVNGSVRIERPIPSRSGNITPNLDPPPNRTTGISDLDSLQRQIQSLQSECEALQQANDTANQDVFAKSGEISIVRANAAKLERDFESRAKALQKSHTDEAARQRVELERTRSELQKLATEKEFLENDLAQGAKQIKHLQVVVKKGHDQAANARPGQATTPKKNILPYGDGFDTNEVQPLSPSELVLRGKGGTPRAGAKRKRKTNDMSPVKPLKLAQPSPRESFEVDIQPNTRLEKPSSCQSRVSPDGRFNFIQKILGHKIHQGQERTIEALSKFTLPSAKEKALSTLLYDRLLALNNGTDENLPAAVALIVISLWSQCIQERFHDPVHLLIDLVQYILLLVPLRTGPELINTLMELIQETSDIIIIPRCQKKPPRKDAAHISSLDCLHIMQLIAQDCSIDQKEITRFWRTMRFDFIMMLLSFVHPIVEIQVAISLLHTSVLEKSFAMIIPPGDGRQDATEARVIDNLSRLLVESPRPAQGETYLNPAELSDLRLQILALMNTMCECKYSAESLAKHRLVVGRLVRVMNDELDRAYDHHHGHEKCIALVNEATRLVYYLTTTHADLISMQARLSVIPGGERKYLIALTRLAFSEGGYLEAGIEDDVVEQAHQMLEMRVSPEEAEQLVEAFASAQSTRREGKEAA